jgi:hypothetical protein
VTVALELAGWRRIGGWPVRDERVPSRGSALCGTGAHSTPTWPWSSDREPTLGIFSAVSLTLAVFTPVSWEPLRPALIVGGLSSLAFLIIGGRLARFGREPERDRETARTVAESPGDP